MTEGRQRVFDPRRNARVYRAQQNAIAFQVTKGLCQHSLADVGNSLLDLAEAQPSVRQIGNDQSGPFVAKPVEDSSYGTIRISALGRVTGSYAHVPKASSAPLLSIFAQIKLSYKKEPSAAVNASLEIEHEISEGAKSESDSN